MQGFLYIRFFIPGKRGNAFADDGRTLTSHVNTAVSAALQQDWSTWRRSQILSRYACRYSGKDFFISFQFILRQKIHRNSNAIIFFNLKNTILNFLEARKVIEKGYGGLHACCVGKKIVYELISSGKLKNKILRHYKDWKKENN